MATCDGFLYFFTFKFPKREETVTMREAEYLWFVILIAKLNRMSCFHTFQQLITSVLILSWRSTGKIFMYLKEKQLWLSGRVGQSPKCSWERLSTPMTHRDSRLCNPPGSLHPAEKGSLPTDRGFEVCREPCWYAVNLFWIWIISTWAERQRWLIYTDLAYWRLCSFEYFCMTLLWNLYISLHLSLERLSWWLYIHILPLQLRQHNFFYQLWTAKATQIPRVRIGERIQDYLQSALMFLKSDPT